MNLSGGRQAVPKFEDFPLRDFSVSSHRDSKEFDIEEFGKDVDISRHTSSSSKPTNTSQLTRVPRTSRQSFVTTDYFRKTHSRLKSTDSAFDAEHQPQKLNRHVLRDMLLSVVLAGLTAPFFWYGNWALRLHRTRVPDHEQFQGTVEYGKKLATAFPFVFALILGRTMKQLAIMRLERGTTLGALEQLIGSRSLGSTFITQILVRRWNLAALVLFIIWAFSPLGSQSSLQILNITNVPIVTYPDVQYFYTESSPGFSSGDVWNIPALNALFSSILMAPAAIRDASMDLWGNVKVPDISRVQENIDFKKHGGWIDLDPAGLVNGFQYSSILGIPLGNIRPWGLTNFQMETSYLELHCYDNMTRTAEGELDFFKNNSTTRARNGTFGGPLTPTPGFFTFTINGAYNYGPFNDISIFLNWTEKVDALTLRFQSLHGITVWCPITTTYVESNVTCQSQDCAVTSVRPSTRPHPHKNFTNLGFEGAFSGFTTNLELVSAAKVHASTSTAVELFLADPNSATRAGFGVADFSNITAEDISLRLQEIINAYWYGSYSPYAMMGNLIPKDTSNSANPTMPENNTPFITDLTKSYITTNSTHTFLQEIYTVNFEWLSVLFAASTICLGAAVLGALCNFGIKGPDILGYSSSLLRDNMSVQGGAERHIWMEVIERGSMRICRLGLWIRMRMRGVR
ncbi:hypothetical protein B0J14DRAFT_560018 [Halenospora varia]|nr:hypothetical protein B0J14DRAFT_560018 [Halenospora varia]